jgi:hypothetical protein
MTGQERILAKLREVLDQPDTVILVGSGVSLWSGLPTWTALLHALADHLEEMGLKAAPVRQEINGGNLLLAASYAVHQIDKRELGAFLRKALRHARASPSELHRLIVALGPSCFITTNYDQLLETAIQQSGQYTELRVVTNRQPVEIADIIPAIARNFLFKYHGDVTDVESIVLCREQYRQIKNEYPHTLRALSTLLATRPALIIGFGLQDPDFLLVQDELVSIFQGQAGEYFAILPDFDDLRINFWRENYRTQVISYDTLLKPNGTRDHSQLLTLVQDLLSAKFRRGHPSPTDRMSAGHLLLLARLAASVAREKPEPLKVSFPLSVEFEVKPKFGFRPHPGRLTDLLHLYEGSFLLLGHPGAGKSVALKQYAAELADALTQRCLSDAGNTDKIDVPLFINLTLYRGSLVELIQSTLPAGLELAEILSTHRCTVVLDAVNEMPREHIESEHWVHEFAQLQMRFPDARFLIGCRNEAWVKVIDLPIFIIGDIDSKFMREQLSGIVPVEALSNPAFAYALATPLLFSLAKSGSVVIQETSTPSRLYEAYWEQLSERWKETTGESVDFASNLETVAHNMLEKGIEYAPKTEFERALSAQFRQVDAPLAALLRDGALIALSGQRVTFFHQSLTEHLAARVIARQFETTPAVLMTLLRDKRWDQTLFLAADYLRPELARKFIAEVLATDIVAGARAANYIRHEQTEIIDVILQEAIERGEDEFEQQLSLSLILQRLPYSTRNMKRLRVLAKKANNLGGTAAGALFKMLPRQRRQIIAASFRHHDDFNYISHYVDTSRDDWTQADIIFFFEKLSSPDNVATDALSSYEILISKLPGSDLSSFCARFLQTSSACRRVILGGLAEVDNSFATSMLNEFVRKGEAGAFFDLYSHLRFRRSSFPPAELPVDEATIKSILRALSTTSATWAVAAGQQLVERNKEWAKAFRRLALKRKADRQIMTELIATDELHREAPILTALKSIPDLNEHQISAVGHDNFWERASTEVLIEALETRNTILVNGMNIHIRGREENIPILRKHNVQWWLDWVEQCCRAYGVYGGSAYVLQQVILKCNKEARLQLLNIFNQGLSEDFWRIGFFLFCRSQAVSTDEFSDAAIQLLMAEADHRGWIPQLLGEAATEQFVVSELLPLVKSPEPRPWLVKTLRAAGRRHNRRYTVWL